MKLAFWKKPTEKKKVSTTREWINAITFAVIAATLIRWTTVEAFVIPTGSMEDTMMVGDYLFVSKFHYGTRTLRTPLQVPLTHQKIWGTEIPSFLPWIELPSYRLPGISEVKREDIVVFNIPPDYLSDRMDYPLDLKTYYVKRCVGLPGDKLEIKNKEIFTNGQPLKKPVNMKFSYLITSNDEIHKRHFTNLGLDTDDYFYMGRAQDGRAIYRVLLTNKQVELTKSMPFVKSFQEDYTMGDGPEERIFPGLKYTNWNGDNYGTLVIPHKGMKISINDSTLSFYGEVIKTYEHNENVAITNGQLTIDGQEVREYTFKQDYYFMMGDNRHNSLDSRYWGFVPEDHIVGKALFVWFSVNSDADWLNKIRWNRIFTKFE
jgi:signal peptidase I